MSLLVVGSLGLDDIETPFGKVESVLGGSASYFSIAASQFTDVNVVAVVGQDFPEQHLQLLSSKGVNINGIQKADGDTFRWQGRYGYDLGDPETLGTYLNVFEHFDPRIPDDYKQSDFVFLANIDPELQLNVLNQVDNPRLVACDTMNFWIENKKDALLEVLKNVDILMINDSEARELGEDSFITKAARNIMEMGPRILIIKRGEYGALKLSKKGIFWAPSYPLEEVLDPTGAGDSFAGGFMGYLTNEYDITTTNLKRSVVYGCVVASFTVEDFSVNRLAALKDEELNKRHGAFMNLTNIE
ncbi:MAG: sugar kinase [Candidatus Dadabacteria bacterium]|nr:sugar kinase [Candidatus Dadabacteria bacterium]NIV41933.1 sugar kinase [Candidatus Dadabacteria bacterium]NIX15804.1 sugar kinase [Candidatus Dadabacteria bacterium]